MDTAKIIEGLKTERATLEPSASVNLAPLRLALESARIAYQAARDDPARPQQLGDAERSHILALDGDVVHTREDFQTAERVQRAAVRRLLEIDELLGADENSQAASNALNQARLDGEKTESELARTQATIRKIEVQITELEAKATERADAAALAALSGDPITAKDNTHAEIAARSSALVGLARIRDTLSATLADIAGRAADARTQLLRSRYAQGELQLQAAMLLFVPVASAAEAATRAAGGNYTTSISVRLDEGAISGAIAALNAESQAWRPSLQTVASDPAESEAVSGDVIEPDRRAA